MTFSVLLHDLDGKPTREDLERACSNIPSIPSLDCIQILRSWYGIVRSGLSHADATALKANLSLQKIGSDVVPDHEIPSLFEEIRCQRLSIHDEELFFATSGSLSFQKSRSELVFISAGMFHHVKLNSVGRISPVELEVDPDGYVPWLDNQPERKLKKSVRFRIDFFFTSPPHRLSFVLDNGNMMFYGDRVIRLIKQLDLKILLSDLYQLLPPARLGHLLRKQSIDESYSDMHSYNEELRWAFYRLGARG